MSETPDEFTRPYRLTFEQAEDIAEALKYRADGLNQTIDMMRRARYGRSLHLDIAGRQTAVAQMLRLADEIMAPWKEEADGAARRGLAMKGAGPET
jgi:UTP:GlnB (protein PII) uridylyltransferase